MILSIKDKTRQAKFQKLIEKRKLASLLDSIEQIVKDARPILPFTLFDGAVSHLMSLFDAIRVQRNDAVHPMNSVCSPDSIRLSLRAFPYALQKVEALRSWLSANPNTI